MSERDAVAELVSAAVNGALQAAMGVTFAPRVEPWSPPVVEVVDAIMTVVQPSKDSPK